VNGPTTKLPHDQAAGLRAIMKQLQARQMAAPRRERTPRGPHTVTPPNDPPSAPASSSREPVDQHQAAPRARLAEVITIASGKGGVGKTSLAVNLAIACAQRRRRVTLVDADFGVANADLLCGITTPRRVEQVLRQSEGGSNAGLASIAVDAPGGFKLVPGSVGIARMADLGAAQRAELARHIVQLESTSDLILIDAGAGVGSLVRSLVASADRCLLVATPEPTAIADAYALVKCCQAERSALHEGGVNWRLVVNSAASEAEARAVYERIRLAADRFLGVRIDWAGWVPADAQIPSAVRARQPMLLRSPHSPAAVAIRSLAAGLDPAPGMTTPTGAQGKHQPGRGLGGWVRRLIGT
jgi:flagellar biosynthesis protein FlhG